MKNNNEIKKVLYKEKPIAKILKKEEVAYYYRAETSLGTVNFQVPLNDMGEKVFEEEIPAQLLIRWIK